jgi:glycosyltransferase involved in cell wall biosynthesis
VSVVIIGHNEATHLAESIRSVMAWPYPEELKEIIYVDNHSTDDSPAIARQFPIKVIALKQHPHTPGLARNAGWRAASGEFVQFLDGDMTLAPAWLHAALPSFQDLQVAAVVGRLREAQPGKSFYNRLFDFNWKLAHCGEVDSPGGGGLFRTSALHEVGGYDSSLFGAEEIDLGYRMRRRGFRALRLPQLMAVHDMDMHSFRHFCKRYSRDGYWEMEMICRYWRWALPWPQSYILKMDAQLLSFLALMIALLYAPQPGLAVLMAALPAFFFLKRLWYLVHATGAWKMSGLAAFFNYLQMLPLAWGQWRYVAGKLKGFVRRNKSTSAVPRPQSGKINLAN